MDEAAVRKYLDEGNRALRAQLAAMNRLRIAHGLAPYVLRERRDAA